MLNKCCLCIDLRSGTLILAGLGVIVNFLLAIKGDIVTALYSICLSIICLLGFIGVLKDNVTLVKVFALYYMYAVIFSFVTTIMSSVLLFHSDPKDICKEMIERDDTDMDLEACIAFITDAKVFIVILLSLKCLVELHFCLAVCSYYQSLRLKTEDLGERLVHDDVVSPPPAYGTIQSTG